MLDVLGIVSLTAVIALNLYAFLDALPAKAATRLALALAAGGWTGLAASAAQARLFTAEPGAPTFPVIGLFVGIPLLATALAALLRPGVRSALVALPTPLLIGLNVSRVLGGFFLLLALNGRLSGPFPFSAGWGDVITGLVALPLALLAARRAAQPGLVFVWNAFGALDLVLALAFGVLSASGSPLQLIHAGVGSAAVQALPWALVPTVLVPFYLVLHAVVFAQLRQGEPVRGAAGQGAVELA